MDKEWEEYIMEEIKKAKKASKISQNNILTELSILDLSLLVYETKKINKEIFKKLQEEISKIIGALFLVHSDNTDEAVTWSKSVTEEIIKSEKEYFKHLKTKEAK